VVVAASFSHVRGGHQPESVKPFSVEYIDGIAYIWLKTPRYSGNGIGRVLNMMAFVGHLFRFAGEIADVCRPEVVIASSTYPLDIYPGYRIARKTNAKLIFEVHDLWPLSPMELGRMSKWHPFIMVMQRAENFAYRVADKVVSIPPGTLKHMTAHGLPTHKFASIPNGVDLNECSSRNGSTGSEPCISGMNELKREGYFLVGYAGAHGIANSLDVLIDAAQRLKDTKVRFVLVGQGPEKSRLRKRVVEADLKNVLFFDPVPKAVIPDLLSVMDVCYLGLQRQPLFRFGVSPDKLMDYMMAAKPIINAIDAGNDPVREARCGISVAPEDPEAIADAITKLMGMSPEEKSAMGLRGKEYVVKNHDYGMLARRFLEVMNTPDQRHIV
jgi:glycosyltransferase involved in cell wall biosynthesis